MAYLNQPDYVKYACSCGQLKPITSLYFCRHCLKIRCGFCLCHEVDSHYCVNCLENMPSSEARLKKNRCSSCFNCPSCFHTLSTRAMMSQPRQSTPDASPGGSGDTKVENKQPKKMYYLCCFNCRWTSRDVGIPDQPVASGGWPARHSPHAARVSQLLEHYKALAQQEKQDKLERERKKFALRGKYITLTDKTGLTSAMARSLAGMPAAGAAGAADARGFAPSQPAAVEPLPDTFYTSELNLNGITNIAQRLASPDWQPASVSRFHPLPKPLTVKRSQRCRACDHNITKPEYNPGSVKFKIELLAYYHVPEIKIISYETVKPGQTTSLLLKLTNPTGHEMQVRILRPEDIPAPAVDEEPRSIDKSLEKSLNIEKEPSLSKAIERPPELRCACAVRPPDAELAVAQRDDAAEYDDDSHHDPGDIIVWRKSNKLALRVEVATDEGAAPGAAAAAKLALQYSYRNTVPPAADHTLYATVVLDLGTVGAL